MDFGKMVTDLMAVGYKRASARAKIAHDVVLAAIKASGMKDSLAGARGGREGRAPRQLWVEAARAAIAFHVLKNLPILQFATLKTFLYCGLRRCLI